MVYYLVNNWFESYMIFSSLEKAKNLVKKLRKRCALNVEEFNMEDVNKEVLIYKKECFYFSKKDEEWYNNYYITELQEGQGFGPGLSGDDEFSFI